MPVSDYIANIADTVKSSWEGMSVTLSYMFRRPMTVQYAGPEEARRSGELIQETLPARYRGFLEVDASICTACQACERACPINVIAIEIEKDPANPKLRVMTRFDIDIGKCMFCGLCVEPCPTGAIQHTKEFEGAQRFLPNLVLRFIDPAQPVPPYKVAKGATAFPRVVLGEITRGLIKQWDSPPPELPLPPQPVGRTREEIKASEMDLAAKAVGADQAKLAGVLERAQAGIDCELCTYPTCRAYASAIASGRESRLHLCEPGGDASARATQIIVDSFKAGQVVVTPEAEKAKYQAP